MRGESWGRWGTGQNLGHKHGRCRKKKGKGKEKGRLKRKSFGRWGGRLEGESSKKKGPAIAFVWG